MSDSPEKLAPEDINLVAHLVGATNAELKAMDDNIIDQSTNLQTSQANWDPKRVIKEAVQQTAGLSRPMPAAEPPPQVMPSVPPAGVHPTVMPGYAQPLPQSQSYGGELTIILQKLVEIEAQIRKLNDRLDGIEYFDKKVIDSLTRGLQNRVKQVTIKLDESWNKQ